MRWEMKVRHGKAYAAVGPYPVFNQVVVAVRDGGRLEVSLDLEEARLFRRYLSRAIREVALNLFAKGAPST